MIIQGKNINVSTRKKKKTILKDVNFEIQAGTITAIVGNNGSGKTTILKSIINSIKGTGLTIDGQIMIDGKEVTSALVKEKIAYIPQMSASGENITLFEYVSLAFYVNSSLFSIMRNKDRELITNAIKKMGLEEHIHENMTNLSGGERQKASIALSIVYPKEIIIFDEPTNHLDMAARKDVIKIIKEFREQGKTIIFTMHEINIAASISEQFLMIKNNTIKYHGTPMELMTPEIIKDIFNVDSAIKTINGLKVITEH